jgi:hypothetical protein
VLACEEVADAQLSVAAESLGAVVDGDPAAEGVEAGDAGFQVNVGEAGAE